MAERFAKEIQACRDEKGHSCSTCIELGHYVPGCPGDWEDTATCVLCGHQYIREDGCSCREVQ